MLQLRGHGAARPGQQRDNVRHGLMNMLHGQASGDSPDRRLPGEHFSARQASE